MLNSISNLKNLSFLLTALTVLFILPAVSAYAVWPELDKLLASDRAGVDRFGCSVSISGDYAIVGAWGNDDDGAESGSAYIFYYDGAGWSEQAKLTASDGAAGDNFGCSVSISGDYAIVGALLDDNDNGTWSGSAYIFVRNGTSWSEQDKLLASDGGNGARFGGSVSVSGDYAIVADDRDSAYIFVRSGISWSEQAKLLASDGAAGDDFGLSVSIDGDYTVIGAHRDNDNGTYSGSAYVFNRSGTIWSQQAKLLPADGAEYDYFGRSVSVSGDYAIVSAYGDDDNGDESGSAYIFKRSGTIWSQQDKLSASDGAAGDNFGKSVSINGDNAIVGASQDDDNGSRSGSAYIFKLSGTIWGQQDKLLAADGATNDYFGCSVSISGDRAIIGALADDNLSGSAYIPLNTSDIRGTMWHDTDGDFFHDIDEEPIEGWRIYIDENDNGQFDAGEANDITDSEGNYVLTGLPAGTYKVAEEVRSCWEQTYPGGNGTYSVTLKMFGKILAGYNFGNARPGEIHPSAWQEEEQDKLLAADGAASDWFGYSVSIDGDYAIVGAHGDDDSGSNSGAAYIFAANDVNCSDLDQVAKLTSADGAVGDRFGQSVSISGHYAIVGAHYDDDNGTDSGSVYIFSYDGTTWGQQAKLLATDGAASDNFGISVSISGAYAIVGANQDDDKGSNSGAVYIFKRDGTSWIEQAKLSAVDGAASDYFGCSVSISGDYAIVGAYQDDDSGSNCGSAYVFKRYSTKWSEQAKLTASDGAGGDWFGHSVSIKGDYAVVGAHYDDDNGDNSGSAYIFRRDGTSWNEQAKLTADDGVAVDWFGYSVSISGDYLVVGARYDDDSGSNSGSAYIFYYNGTGWHQQAKLLAADGAANDYFGCSVSISGDYAIIGAYADDDNGSTSGSAYMFGKVLCPSMDGTDDCLVDFKDFAIMAGQWLQGVK